MEKFSLIVDVLIGWSVVLLVDLGVVFLFYRTAQNSVSKEKTQTPEDQNVP